MKSNYAKYYVMQTTYALALMFCSGTVLQAFLLEYGFSEGQVYAYNAMIQMVQTAIMLASMFFADRIQKTKVLMGICILSLLLLFSAQFVVLGKESNPPVVLFFVMGFITYCCVGLQSIEGYKLPYQIFDIRDYGRVCGVSAAIAKVFCFACSVLYSFFIIRFRYSWVHVGFFSVMMLCVVLASASCFLFKEKSREDKETPLQDLQEQCEGVQQKKRNYQAFKNKATYLLLIPNFLRGITTGIVSLLATIGISKAIITTQTSSYMNIAMQVALFLGNVFFAFSCNKRFSVKKIMLISAVVMGVFLPLSILRENPVDFIVGYLIVQFFMILVDTAIPVLVTEMIPYEQMGTFTAIRLSVYMFGSFVISAVLDWALKTVGHLPLFIIASVMQIICCTSYYLVSKRFKAQTGEKEDGKA